MLLDSLPSARRMPLLIRGPHLPPPPAMLSLSHLASRISHLASRISHLASRISQRFINMSSLTTCCFASATFARAERIFKANTNANPPINYFERVLVAWALLVPPSYPPRLALTLLLLHRACPAQPQ